MPTLRLFCAKRGKKTVFKPLNPGHIQIYVCGPTVYDFVHVGNAFSAVVFDVLFRLLQGLYPKAAVTYVRNITDVDDRINEKAQQTGKLISEIAERYSNAYRQNMEDLHCLPPTLQPRATDHIKPVIDTIRKLLDFGHAYESEGHVLFSVPSYKNYGALTKKTVDNLLAGARVEPTDYKRHPADFVLWKPSNAKTQPGWDSPWGYGRPGWHIECTAMIHANLGTDIDIHGGGFDLQFPHHENERAQGLCAAPGSCYANYWMHNGLLQHGSTKISKSLGNFETVNSLMEKAPGGDRKRLGETIRYAFLSGHYRGNLQWSANLLSQSDKSLHRLYNALLVSFDQSGPTPDRTEAAPDIQAALLDDLNTPKALALMHQRANKLLQKPGPDKKTMNRLASEIRAAGQLLGLTGLSDNRLDRPRLSPEQARQIEKLIAIRKTARDKKDFSKADRIRDELANAGIALEYEPDGSVNWRARHS